MPRIIAALIRHGDYKQLKDTPSAWQPFALNKAGKKQASEAALQIEQTIKEQNWQLDNNIHSSTLLRAWQTADIISQGLSYKNNKIAPSINCFDALAERSVGSVANLSVDKIETIIINDPRLELPPKNWKSNSHYCLPFQGAESLMNSGLRVAKHIQESLTVLKKTAKHDSLKLFVGHGAAFRHAAFHLGILEFEQIAPLSMYHAQPIYIEQLENQQYQHLFGHWKKRKNSSEYTD